jgi:hypothetical protein
MEVVAVGIVRVGLTAHSPRASAVVVAITVPPAVIVTVALKPAVPARFHKDLETV